jgi:hypothetical protein
VFRFSGAHPLKKGRRFIVCGLLFRFLVCAPASPHTKPTRTMVQIRLPAQAVPPPRRKEMHHRNYSIPTHRCTRLHNFKVTFADACYRSLHFAFRGNHGALGKKEICRVNSVIAHNAFTGSVQNNLLGALPLCRLKKALRHVVSIISGPLTRQRTP